MVCSKCGGDQHGTGTAHGTVCTGELGEDNCLGRGAYMKKKKTCKVISLVLLVCILFQTSILCVLAEDNDVKITESEYEVYYPGVPTNFLCNKKTLGSELGTEYYLTYTVESVTECGTQAGLIGTSDPELDYPYTEGKGKMYYQQEAEGSKTNPLFLEGYTYLIKYEVTENGFRYTAAKAKDDEAEYFTLNDEVCEGTTVDTKFSMKHLGIWVAGGMTNLKLSHVRFYDKAGNDLGLYSKGNQLVIVQNAYREKDTEIDHRYTIEAKDLANLAISNAKPLLTDKMFIEYTVRSNASACNQTGVALSNEPKESFPHGTGLLKYYSDCSLLQEGADYLITLEKIDDSFTALIQITKDGKTTFSTFPWTYGEYNAKSQYFSLWFGEGLNYANFVLKNVKMYDENKNNLGIQSNNIALVVQHFGEVLDYSGCEAVYYCEENESYYALYANQKLFYTKDAKTVAGTYSISQNVIKMKKNNKTEKCDYLYQCITDSEGNEYDRLSTYKVRFVSGSKEEVDTQTLNITTGYTVQKPSDPILTDCTFEGWCTADGKEFDFDTIVTKSKTLYAKWSDNAGVEYLAVGDGKIQVQRDYTPYIVIGGCIVFAFVAVAGSALMIRGGMRYGSNKIKKEKSK